MIQELLKSPDPPDGIFAAPEWFAIAATGAPAIRACASRKTFASPP